MKRKTCFFICVFLFTLISNVYPLNLKEKINTIISQLEKKYSISFVYDSVPVASWKEVTFSEAKTKTELTELLSYLKMFSEEFNKYPPAFIKRINLKYVAFVRVLKYGEQHRSALPDGYKEILYLDILRGVHKDLYLGRDTKYYLRHTMHHELYHLIEQKINGSCYYKDSIWNSFNPANNHYGNGGASMYPDMSKKPKKPLFPQKPYKIKHPKQGMITAYACTALEEDKAEVFASLFVKREIRQVNRCMKKDDVVAKKEIYMKQFVLKL